MKKKSCWTPRPRPYQCQFCPKCFMTVSTCHEHESLVHNPDRKFACTLCDYRGTKACHVNLHMATHDKVKRFPCHLCPYKGRLQGNLTRHLKIVHENLRPFRCHFCKYASNTKANLTNHLRTHGGEKEKTEHCPHCDYKTILRSSLQVHLLTHTGEKPFTCPICGHASRTSSHLHAHISSIHTGEKPYNCAMCQKSFVTSTLLNMHVRVHTGEKPYKCSLKGCHYTSATSSAVRSHERDHIARGDCSKVSLPGRGGKVGRRIGSFVEIPQKKLLPIASSRKDSYKILEIIDEKDKKSGCPLCHKLCQTGHQFSVHMQSHTLDMPFKCPVEGCRFAAEKVDNLKSHEERVHH